MATKKREISTFFKQKKARHFQIKSLWKMTGKKDKKLLFFYWTEEIIYAPGW